MKHEVHSTDISKSQVDLVQKIFKENKGTLNEYVSKLQWWNKRTNLVSRDVSRETLLRHVEHSLTIASSDLFKKAPLIIDSGTGGGLPGIPLAIAYPQKTIVLNDVVSKKITACKHISSFLKLKNIEGVTGSIEKFLPEEDALLVSKHAFKINDLLKMTEGKPWGGMILLKGARDVERELEGVEESLKINVIDLYSGFSHSFYKGKALVEIIRKG